MEGDLQGGAGENAVGGWGNGEVKYGRNTGGIEVRIWREGKCL